MVDVAGRQGGSVRCPYEKGLYIQTVYRGIRHVSCGDRLPEQLSEAAKAGWCAAAL